MPAYPFYSVLRLGWRIIVLGLMRPGVYWAAIAREMEIPLGLTNKARDFINDHRRAIGEAVLSGNWSNIEDIIFGDHYRDRQRFKDLVAELGYTLPHSIPDWLSAREAIDRAPPLDPETPIDVMIMEWLCGPPFPSVPEAAPVSPPDSHGERVGEITPPPAASKNPASNRATSQPIEADGIPPPPESEADPQPEQIDPDELINWVVPLVRLGRRASIFFSDHGLGVLKNGLQVPDIPKSQALLGVDEEKMIKMVVRYINIGAWSESYLSEWFLNAVRKNSEKKQDS